MPAADADQPSHSIGAVILGAGFARRFGSDKRLHPLHGSTVAECTVRRYVEVFDDIRVVIRADDRTLQGLLAPAPVELIVAEDAHLGMGHSLAAGFGGLAWKWAFVALLDMPFVSADTLRQLRAAAAACDTPSILRPRLTRPDAAETPAHPVGWHNAYFDELRACRGDTGAKALLERHAEHVIDVELDDPGLVRDIDRPEDLA